MDRYGHAATCEGFQNPQRAELPHARITPGAALLPVTPILERNKILCTFVPVFSRASRKKKKKEKKKKKKPTALHSGEQS